MQDGRTGWLVPPADPAALAQRLRELLQNPMQRRAMGTAGRARAKEEFSTDRMVAAIAKIYDDLLDSPRSHSGRSEPGLGTFSGCWLHGRFCRMRASFEPRQVIIAETSG